MVNKTIKQVVKKYLNALKEQGLPIRFGVIFGSQLKKKTDQWSDIDVLVISPLFDKVRSRKLINLLWHTTIKINSRIEPIPCGEDQWEKDDSSPIIEIARRENVKKLLENREWLKIESDGFYLDNPEKLLSEWAENYQFRKNQVRDFYSMKDIPEIEAIIGNLCRSKGLKYALTGFSGAARLAPAVRYKRAFVYIEGSEGSIAS